MASTRLSFQTEERPLRDFWTTPLAQLALARHPDYPLPTSLEAIGAVVAARRAAPDRPAPEALAAAIGAHLERFDPPAPVLDNVARLGRADAVAVVAGQQVAPFGGPLYTVLKALGAIDVAARLRAQGLPAVPVFWAATEDDDIAEVSTVWVVDRGHHLRDVGCRLSHRAGQSVGALALSCEEVDAVAAALLDAAPPTRWAQQAAEAWRRAAAGRTLGEAFTAWLLSLLGHLGLVVVDPMERRFRALAAPLLHRVLDDPLAPTRLAAEAGAALETKGYRRATHRPSDLCAFYLYRDGCRSRLRRRGEQLVTEHGEAYSVDALRRALDEDPSAFSSSLLLRPVVQDYLLPTAAFLVGPGEMAYAAQVAPIYRWLGVAPPVVLPRRSATVIEPAPAARLARYELDFTALLGDLGALVAKVTRATVGEETAARFAAVRGDVRAAAQEAVAHATDIDPGLSAAGEALLRRLDWSLRRYEDKVHRALRRRDRTVRRRLEEAAAYLAPWGGLQERRLSVAHFLVRYGPDFVDALAASMAGLPLDRHLVFRLAP